jgi:D-sedoheptulose 7-phosphate isomerase
MTGSRLEDNIEAAVATLRGLAPLAEDLERAAALAAGALGKGGKLLSCGNGGSAAEALHLAAELVCRFEADRRPYPAQCLNASGPDLTAIGNDYAFEDVFARQVEAFGRPGDLLVALSTTGRSENVRRALVAARAKGVASLAFLGRDGGPCRELADVALVVPGSSTARIQEAHALLVHTLCESVERRLREAGGTGA